MLENVIRNQYQKWLVNPVADWIDHRVSPTFITALRAVFGFLFAPAFLLRCNSLAIFFLLLSGYLDTLDGTVARLQNNSTDWGAVLDIMADRWVEFCVIFSFFWIDPAGNALGSILMLGSILLCVTGFLVVGAFSKNMSSKGFYYSPGVMERAEAFIFFVLIVLAPHYFSELAYIFSSLVFVTAVSHLYQFSINSAKLVEGK